MGAPELITIIGLGITIVVVGLVLLGCLRLSRWFHKSRPKPAPGPKTAIPPWIWILVIALVALISFLMNPKKRPGQPFEPLISPWVVGLWMFGVFVVLFVAVYAVAVFRHYDRDASRALKLAQAGDKDGALFELRAAMDGRKPSATLSNALGLVHFLREEWPEAYKAFLDAQSIGGKQASYVGNQGVALLKMGRLDEAAVLLVEADRMAPGQPLIASNYGLVLADLGRIEEAVAQLARVEKNLRSWITLVPGSRTLLLSEITLLRERIEAARGRQRLETGAEADPATG
jgi:tetratricopeptide (TPR) repeat protein